MNKSVFIVEDDEDIARNLRELLECETYRVEVAYDGRAALQKLRTLETLPALILLDLMMPVMDGFQFREEQERDPKLANIPVVIMTADGHGEIKRMKIGAKD